MKCNFATAMKIQDKIRIIRTSKGYTQEFIAEKLNIDPVNYGRIERGLSKLTIERFLKIVEILEIKPSELFDEVENKNQQEILKQVYQVEVKILDELKKINSKIN